jgi:hypothetical protein
VRRAREGGPVAMENPSAGWRVAYTETGFESARLRARASKEFTP